MNFVNPQHLSAMVQYSIFRADEYSSEIPKDVEDAPVGFTGAKTRHLLNNICKTPGTRYLEVGLWAGATFCSALYRNQAIGVGIDNWSEFGGPKQECLSNVNRWVGHPRATLVDSDCFKVDVTQLPHAPFNVFFYDGGHSEEDHYRALGHFAPCLAGTFVFLVDDWQQLEAQRGTLYAMRDLGWKVHTEWVKRSIDNDEKNWWCGLYLAVVSKK